MANFYVSRSGSDLNNGSSWELAKATIQAAAGAATVGDTIYVGEGRYTESFSIGQTQRHFIAVGRVVWDAGGAAYCYQSGYGYQAFSDYFEGFIFQGGSECLLSLGGAGPSRTIIKNCEFVGSQAAIGLGLQTYTPDFMRLDNCIFRGQTSTTTPVVGHGGNYTSINKCSFFDTATLEGCIKKSYGVLVATNNAFRDCAVMINLSTAVAIIDNNAYDFTGGNCVYGGVDKTTLADWRAAFSLSNDGSSISGIPEWNDVENALFGALPGGNVSSGIGAIPVAFAASPNINAENWSGGAHDGTEFMDDKLYLASGNTSGSYTLPTMDIGAILRIRSVSVAALNETNDNRAEVEYRSSAISQAHCESQPFMDVTRSVAGLVTISGDVRARWVQVKINLTQAV